MNKAFKVLILLTLLSTSLTMIGTPVRGQNVQLAPPPLDWQKTYPGYTASWIWQDSSGYAFFVEGTQKFEAVVSNAVLNKISSSGSIVWSKQFDVPFPERIIHTSDGYEYTNRADSFLDDGPVTINMLDENGNLQWSHTLQDSYDGSVQFIHTNDGGYALATQNRTGLVLIKTDSHATEQWTHVIRPIDSQYSMRQFVQTSDGGFAFTGSFSAASGFNGTDFFLAKIDSSGSFQWSKTFGGASDDDANSVVQTSDGGYALVGNTQSFGAGGTNALMIKTDGSGNLEWAHTYGGSGKTMNIPGQTDFQGHPVADVQMTVETGDDYANCLIQTEDGGLAFAGTTSNFMWLVKTDSNGNEEWSQAYGNYETAFVYAEKIMWGLSSFIQADDGSYLLAGDAVGQSIWDHGCFIVKTQPEIPVSTILPPIPVSSLCFGAITINANGTITPSSAPIAREDNEYKLTADINNPLIVKADNVVVNGQGHLINGNGTLGNLFVQQSAIGINASSAQNVNLINFQIQNFKVGILLDKSNRVNISQNTLSLDYRGILGSLAQNALVENNTIFGINQEGIRLTSCLNSKVTDNTLVNSVSIENSSGNIISNNKFNGADIVLQGSQNTLMSGNQFLAAFLTVQIHDSQGITVAANNFEGCHIPIIVSGTRGILIYTNNFVNNSYPPEISPDTDSAGNPNYPIEHWDNGKSGNFWSNYTQAYPNTKQADNTGTWDTPYAICDNNTDHHPLIQPVSLDTMQSQSKSLILAHSPSTTLSNASTGPSWTPDLTWSNIALALAVGTVAIALLIIITLKHQKNKQTKPK